MTTRVAVVAAGAVIAALLAGPVAGASDPAVEALRERDAYVSGRAVADPAAEKLLLAAVAELAERGPVKLGIVVGPVGSPSMAAYARRLRRELNFAGTVVVSAVGRPTVVAGPLPARETTTALREARVQRITDPVARTIAAARATVRSPSNRGWRGPLLLIGLGLIGGLWSVAIGMRRLRRDERVRADGLRRLFGEALEVTDRRGVAHDAGPGDERAAEIGAEVREAMSQTDSVEDLRALVPRVREALALLDPPVAGDVADLDRRLAAEEAPPSSGAEAPG